MAADGAALQKRASAKVKTAGAKVKPAAKKPPKKKEEREHLADGDPRGAPEKGVVDVSAVGSHGDGYDVEDGIPAQGALENMLFCMQPGKELDVAEDAGVGTQKSAPSIGETKSHDSCEVVWSSEREEIRTDEARGSDGFSAEDVEAREAAQLQEARELNASLYLPCGYEMAGIDIVGMPPHALCTLSRNDAASTSASQMLAEEEDCRRRAVLRCLESADACARLGVQAGFSLLGADLSLEERPTISVRLEPQDRAASSDGAKKRGKSGVFSRLTRMTSRTES